MALFCLDNTGPPHGLHILELRKDSLVLLWEPPTFTGRSPITGYYVDIKEGKGGWRGVQDRSTKNTYLQVTTKMKLLYVWWPGKLVHMAEF